MMSILSEGFFGEKLYAAMAAMRFAANPLMLLWRVCSIWTMFFNSSFIVSINNLSPSRILSRRCINEFFMFLHMRVIRWRQKTKNSGCTLGAEVGAGALSKKASGGGWGTCRGWINQKMGVNSKKHCTRQKQKFETSKAACYKRIA